MIVTIITLVFNICVGLFCFFRLGKQRVYTELFNDLKRLCEENEKLWMVIQELEREQEDDRRKED